MEESYSARNSDEEAEMGDVLGEMGLSVSYDLSIDFSVLTIPNITISLFGGHQSLLVLNY